MLVEAVVVLDDPDSGAPLSVLVEADAQAAYSGAVSRHSFGTMTALGATWAVFGRSPRRDEGSDSPLLGHAQDLVDAEVNQWRVMEALGAAYDAKTKGGA